MSKPKLYGIANSRAFRSIWAAEEVDLDYEHLPVTYGEDSKEQTFLDVNPNGRIPALVEGDLQLFESMAINMYLAKEMRRAFCERMHVAKRRFGNGVCGGLVRLNPYRWPWLCSSFLHQKKSGISVPLIRRLGAC